MILDIIKNNVEPDNFMFFFQARPRRRSGEMVARDLKKRQPSRPPSPDLPENLSIKKTKSTEKVQAYFVSINFLKYASSVFNINRIFQLSNIYAVF